tara:strand:- start:83 stop:850 length:768 start_codon:yes stop_codon:yes gene_type:complete
VGSDESKNNMTKLEINSFSHWNSGDVLQNIVRGPFAEWLVHHALGIDPGKHRDPWAEFDVPYRGTGLEVKAAAYFQRWEQKKPAIIFPTPKKQRNGIGFVFCLLGKEDDWKTRREPDPLDMSEWLFWVVACQKLPETETISLDPFRKLFGDAIRFDQVRGEVDKLISEAQETNTGVTLKHEPCPLTDKQQRAIANMVNNDRTFIPENETAEEKKYREYLIAESDGLFKAYGKRPVFEIPEDWGDLDMSFADLSGK